MFAGYSICAPDLLPTVCQFWSVTMRMFQNGERRPILIDGTGIPHFYSTLFITTQARNIARMPNTSRAMLDAIRILLNWASSHGIDIEKRFTVHQLLAIAEIESLRGYVQVLANSPSITQSSKAVTLPRRGEGSRAKLHASAERVKSETQYKRISYILKYLHWLALQLNDQNPSKTPQEFDRNLTRMTKSLQRMRPPKGKKSRINARKGLKPDSEARLLKLVKTGSDDNPFDPSVQKRNELVVLLCNELGSRRGELLALETTDFDFQANTVVIARRHGNIQDPRTDQPVAKTFDRRVPISRELSDRIFEYILHIRSKFPRAQKHKFLIVVHKKGPHQGNPLSTKGFGKIYPSIQKVDPDEFGKLTSHTLRHTKNERFAAQMRKSNVPGPLAEKAQSYMSGWAYGSRTSATYTQRHIEEVTNEAMLKLQRFPKKRE